MAAILPKSSQAVPKSGDFPVQQDPPSSPNGALAEQDTKELVRWFKLLADETRLRILYFLLENDELNVRTLCDLLRQSQPAVSHHLALLRVDGLIECRRAGKHNFYRVRPQRFEQLMGRVFDALPGVEPQIRLGDRLLSFTPIDGP